MNLTDRYIDRILYFLNAEWNAESYRKIKECLLDYTGVLLAGAEYLRDRHDSYIQIVGEKNGNAFAAGTGRRTDVFSAALLNGLSAHVLELDDGHRYGMLHPGVTIFSALLAIAEQEHMQPEIFLKAAAAGYEAAVRLACMVQPVHKKKGFHASATCGTIGVAVAVGIARDYGRQTLCSAVSAAATSASGLLEMIDDNSELKPYNCAQAAVNGIIAANIALCGYCGPNDALGGNRGFIAALNGMIDPDKVDTGLNMQDCIGTIYRKMYASCRHTHSAVEAALKLRNRSRQKSKEIICVLVETYDLAVFGHDRTDVKNISSAKMSTPYAVAAALLYGKSGLEAFTDELIRDKEINSFMRRIKVVGKDSLSELAPAKRAAIVTVTYSDGKQCSIRVDYPKGEPENQLTQQEMREKFTGLLFFAGRSQGEAQTLIKDIESLEEYWSEYLSVIRQERGVFSGKGGNRNGIYSGSGTKENDCRDIAEM